LLFISAKFKWRFEGQSKNNEHRSENFQISIPITRCLWSLHCFFTSHSSSRSERPKWKGKNNNHFTSFCCI